MTSVYYTHQFIQIQKLFITTENGMAPKRGGFKYINIKWITPLFIPPKWGQKRQGQVVLSCNTYSIIHV